VSNGGLIFRQASQRRSAAALRWGDDSHTEPNQQNVVILDDVILRLRTHGVLAFKNLVRCWPDELGYAGLARLPPECPFASRFNALP
jgi:hypothetical protein